MHQLVDGFSATVPIIVAVVLGFVFAGFYCWVVARTSLDVTSAQLAAEHRAAGALQPLNVNTAEGGDIPDDEQLRTIKSITAKIAKGATTFLYAEYRYMAVFIVVMSVILIILVGFGSTRPTSQGGYAGEGWARGGLTMVAFILGAVSSIVAGFIGMKIATFANGRTALRAMAGHAAAFNLAFRAGCVMGFSLCALALIILFIAICLFQLQFPFRDANLDLYTRYIHSMDLYESIAGYGLGGSSIALFGRVGGGIYTKAADVGADLVGKTDLGINEDDPRNPATIADNVGDNVGDIAGMGADLFGSFAESTCAALVVASASPTTTLSLTWVGMSFPLMISAFGIFVCFITSFLATNIMPVKGKKDIEPTLTRQLLVSTIIMTPILYALCVGYLPDEFTVNCPLDAISVSVDLLGLETGLFCDASKIALYGGNPIQVKNWGVFFCGLCGLWSGLIIGYFTDYMTSNAHGPVQEVARSCDAGGAATNIIYGLALGYWSVTIPVICLCITIYVSFSLAWMFGVAVAALGILSTLSIGLTIDAYGPISDNAGGIAEMSNLGAHIRERTDDLDAAGNTTAAIGKGFAIGSAALVSLALFGAYVSRTSIAVSGVNLMEAFPFAGLLLGAMLPYTFSAMTMKSVGKAAAQMCEEVRGQFKDGEVMAGRREPNYESCIRISTEASLREMLPPGALVMITPLFIGIVFGQGALAGMLAGSLVSGVQMAISMSNTGGAWDNAKKYIEKGHLGRDKGKHTPVHAAAVVGDTVGDPLKDTSGPALNILMKLMAVESLVFASFITFVNEGDGLVQWRLHHP
jgi:inorganic pyrophosphatase